MRANVTDCSDHDAVYGILTVENKSLEEVQKKILEIKEEFKNEGIDDWDIDDLLAKFPEDWKYNFESPTEDVIEI